MSKLLKAYDRSRVSLYIQVASVIRQRIESRVWLPGEKISTLEELEREFHVARVTVRQAIEVLRQEGLLFCQQGRGTFVSEKAQNRHWHKLAASWDSLIESIKDNVPKRITVDEETSPPELEPGDGDLAPHYVLLRSVQYQEGEPYSIVNLHLAKSVFDRDPAAFLNKAALPVLAALKGVIVRDAHQTLVVGSADPETADLLKIALGAPTAECRCIVVDGAGLAIYVANIIYRSDCIKLHMDLLAATSRFRKRPRRAVAPKGPAQLRRELSVDASGLLSS